MVGAPAGSRVPEECLCGTSREVGTGAPSVTRNPRAWEQRNDEGLVNDVPAVTTMPRRFEALPLCPRIEEAYWVLGKL